MKIQIKQVRLWSHKARQEDGQLSALDWQLKVDAKGSFCNQDLMYYSVKQSSSFSSFLDMTT